MSDLLPSLHSFLPFVTMDMLSIIHKLGTLSSKRRTELAEKWQSNSLTPEDKEELKKHVAIAVVKLEDQKIAREIETAGKNV